LEEEEEEEEEEEKEEEEEEEGAWQRSDRLTRHSALRSEQEGGNDKTLSLKTKNYKSQDLSLRDLPAGSEVLLAAAPNLSFFSKIGLLERICR
jgi:hypothetical protein